MVRPKVAVIPAKAGIQSHTHSVSTAFWIPAFAGMTATRCYSGIVYDLLDSYNYVLLNAV